MKKISWSQKLFTIISSLGISLLLSSLTSAVFFSFSSYPPRLVKNTKQPPKLLIFKNESQIKLCKGESYFGYKLWGIITEDKEKCAIPEIYPWYPYPFAWYDFEQKVENLFGVNKKLFYLYKLNQRLVENELKPVRGVEKLVLEIEERKASCGLLGPTSINRKSLNPKTNCWLVKEINKIQEEFKFSDTFD